MSVLKPLLPGAVLYTGEAFPTTLLSGFLPDPGARPPMTHSTTVFYIKLKVKTQQTWLGKAQLEDGGGVRHRAYEKCGKYKARHIPCILAARQSY